ncbi:hypothetical protein KNE206_52680 [Kitasatospora sp. NE20-6]|uniref:effector-associated constant component EACC1 n=1 Tax=Kitasatospora sp. NE20-6 TaxID=2859066 RepID=UPI0034DC95E5
MLVRIEPESGGGDLLRWLRSDPVAAQAELSVAASEPGLGEMDVIDVVQAVIADATGLGGLLVAIAAWRDARRQSRRLAAAPTVVIRCGEVRVEVAGDDPAVLQRTVDTLLASEGRTAGEGDTTS